MMYQNQLPPEPAAPTDVDYARVREGAAHCDNQYELYLLRESEHRIAQYNHWKELKRRYDANR